MSRPGPHGLSPRCSQSWPAPTPQPQVSAPATPPTPGTGRRRRAGLYRQLGTASTWPTRAHSRTSPATAVRRRATASTRAAASRSASRAAMQRLRRDGSAGPPAPPRVRSWPRETLRRPRALRYDAHPARRPGFRRRRPRLGHGRHTGGEREGPACRGGAGCRRGRCPAAAGDARADRPGHAAQAPAQGSAGMTASLVATRTEMTREDLLTAVARLAAQSADLTQQRDDALQAACELQQERDRERRRADKQAALALTYGELATRFRIRFEQVSIEEKRAKERFCDSAVHAEAAELAAERAQRKRRRRLPWRRNRNQP